MSKLGSPDSPDWSAKKPPKRIRLTTIDDSIKNDPANDDCILLNQTAIGVGTILPFLGPGHFIFLALVNQRRKDLYGKYFSGLQKKEIPLVRLNERIEQAKLSCVPAIPSNTFFTVAFSTVSCAEFWDRNKGEVDVENEHELSRLVAKAGKLDVLKWAQSKCFRMNFYTLVEAAERGHLHVLNYVRENGDKYGAYGRERPAINSVVIAGASEGRLEVLKWARANGAIMNGWICFEAAQGGHLEVLKWAHKNRIEAPQEARVCSHSLPSLSPNPIKLRASNSKDNSNKPIIRGAMMPGLFCRFALTVCLFFGGVIEGYVLPGQLCSRKSTSRSPTTKSHLASSLSRRQEISYSDEGTAVVRPLPGGLTIKSAIVTGLIIFSLAESVTENPFDLFDLSFSIVDAAVPLTWVDTVAVTVGEVTAGLVAPFVSLGVVNLLSRLDYSYNKNNNMQIDNVEEDSYQDDDITIITNEMEPLQATFIQRPTSLDVNQAVVDADFLIARAATKPLFTFLLPPPLVPLAASLAALVPSLLVRQAALDRDLRQQEEIEWELHLLEQEDEKLKFFGIPFYFTEMKNILENHSKALPQMQLPHASSSTIVALDLLADLLRWLAYGVLSVKYEGSLSPSSPVLECAVYGVLANTGALFYQDLINVYCLDDEERQSVLDRSARETKSLYLSNAICGATLFGLYQAVQVPAAEFVAMYLES